MESLQKFGKLFLELLHDAGFHSAASDSVRAYYILYVFICIVTPLYRYVSPVFLFATNAT